MYSCCRPGYQNQKKKVPTREHNCSVDIYMLKEPFRAPAGNYIYIVITTKNSQNSLGVHQESQHEMTLNINNSLDQHHQPEC